MKTTVACYEQELEWLRLMGVCDVAHVTADKHREQPQPDNTLGFVFIAPYAKSSIKQEAPRPSTSVDDDSATRRSNSADEWKVCECPERDDGQDGRNGKSPRLQTTRKPRPAKKEKGRIRCQVCGKAFHAVSALVNHTGTHPRDVCGICGKRFETEENFVAHLKTHVKAGVCSICGKCFGASRALEMHMRIHTGEKPFSCSQCGKSFNCQHNMRRHVRIHTGEKPYPCPVCGRHFNDYSTRKRHLLVHLKKSGASTDPLAKSKSKTATPRKDERRVKRDSDVSLASHTKGHAEVRVSDSEENLKVHLKSHRNRKVCEVCGKCFHSQKHLEAHMRIHTGEKPFVCSECGKAFSCHHNMLRHLRTHTGETPFECDTCGRGFRHRSSLKQHGVTHTREKPHSCKVCGKSFYRKAYVTLHMKSHTNV